MPVPARMFRQRRRYKVSEVARRWETHSRELRFRDVHPVPDMPRRGAVVVLTGARTARFGDGCFWHGCRERGTRPRVRASWRDAKLGKNVDRDRDTDARLLVVGWTLLRFRGRVTPVSAAGKVDAAHLRLIFVPDGRSP